MAKDLWIAIPLRDRTGAVVAYAKVSAIDAEHVAAFAWSLNSNGYAWRTNGHPKHLYLHRAIANQAGLVGPMIDHVNRDRLDNRRSNLRVVTPAESRQNTSALGGASRYRGVGWDRARGKWRAAVQLNRRVHHLGRFNTEEEAAAVASAFRREHMPFSEDAGR